jgi:hypothetical protein
MPSNGTIENLEISRLRLDPLNPRLPEDQAGGSQRQLAEYIAMAYDALSVATSIAEHGYFTSEPLIALQQDDHFVVVEGNRRLTAILGLTDPELRSSFPGRKDWDRAAEDAARNENLPVTVPVLIVENRLSVAPIIGYRHISGILPWEPFAKARFIAALVEDEDLEFQEVGEYVGEKKGSVASAYRNFAILRQAKIHGELDTSHVENYFGVFTAAMSRVPVRGFIGAPAPGEVRPRAEPIPDDKIGELGELLEWLAGDKAVITDSRQLDDLGEIISDPVGLRALRDTRSLNSARDAMAERETDPRKQLLNRLTAIRSSVRLAAAQSDEVEKGDRLLISIASECLADLDALISFLS